SITSTDVAAGLEKAGIIIDKRRIALSKPIHQLGNYEITIKLSKDFAPKIRVIVAGEEETAEGGKSETAAA
ncbi:MAG: 50S ribosomal L9 C-terminal domain-containing protein, partial [Chloroflexota bacterium]|nr:50S ribosomal L9 C-terminal domain-containing protein [Chloroflexota bacterium]